MELLFQYKKENHPKLSQICSYGIFPRDSKMSSKQRWWTSHQCSSHWSSTVLSFMKSVRKKRTCRYTHSPSKKAETSLYCTWGLTYVLKYIHSIPDISKAKFIPNYWYFKVNFQAPESLLWDTRSLRYSELKCKEKWEMHPNYSRPSLSRLRLSRITAYLKEKDWSLF